jgi:hypothetical protein
LLDWPFVAQGFEAFFAGSGQVGEPNLLRFFNIGLVKNTTRKTIVPDCPHVVPKIHFPQAGAATEGALLDDGNAVGDVYFPQAALEAEFGAASHGRAALGTGCHAGSSFLRDCFTLSFFPFIFKSRIDKVYHYIYY